MKTIYNPKLTRIEAKDGRKVAFSVPTGKLTQTAIDGILAAFAETAPDQAALEAAVAAALARKASVIPDHYRHQYGVTQSCGDRMATILTEEVNDEGKVSIDRVRAVAATNGVEDRFDVWLTKGLNPGMLRMNLGNVLRGKLRRGEVVTVGDQTFNEEQPAD